MKKILYFLFLYPLFIYPTDCATDLHLRSGHQQSFSIDSRCALFQKENHLLFGNLKGGIGSTNHIFTPHANDPFIEGNAGLGYRFLSQKGTFGIYSYYGRLKTPYYNYFSRATIGLEYFNNNVGGYLNFYTPLGKRNQTIDKKFGFNKFQFNFIGHNLRFGNYGKREIISPLSIELGLQKNFEKVSARISGYIHTASSHVKNRTGGNLELSSAIGHNFFLTANAGYDSLYRAQGQIGVIYTFGRSAPTRCADRQILAPVHLEEFFWVQRGKEVFNNDIVKSDIFFVDSSRTYSQGFQGDGTFERPFLNASLANSAITPLPDATVYFYQGNGGYQDFGTFNLIGTQTLTGQGGNFVYQNVLLLPGSNATRPFLERNMAQEVMNTPLITVTDGGSNTIENIGVSNASGNIATGGSLITNVGNSINSLLISNITATDKVTLFLMSGSQNISLFNNDIYGVDLKTFNSASLDVKVDHNIFRTNTMIAQRFFQPIGASLFAESLDSSNLVVSSIENNSCYNTTLNGSAHLSFGYLSSGTSTHQTPNGFLENSSIGSLPAASAGAFLFQGVDTSRVNVQGCFNNFSATDEFTLQNCDVNIKKVGFPGNVAGLSQANFNTVVSPFASVNVFNAP